jgi:hypothetical protein
MNCRTKLAFTLKSSSLLLIPLISTVVGAPCQAVTIASSEAGFRFQNFSSNPLNVNTSAFSVTFTQAKGSASFADGDANAFFTMIEPFAISETRSFARGQGNNFFGLADSQTEVLGNFLVDSNENFSFNFDGFLDISTSTESPTSGEATAAAAISWLLIDTTQNSESKIVGFFDVFAQLDTLGNNDMFIFPQSSDNVTLDFLNSDSNVGATENMEFISTEFAGSLNTSFPRPTSLTLLEIQNSFALVEKTPEFTSILSIFSLGIFGLILKKQSCRF